MWGSPKMLQAFTGSFFAEGVGGASCCFQLCQKVHSDCRKRGSRQARAAILNQSSVLRNCVTTSSLWEG